MIQYFTRNQRLEKKSKNWKQICVSELCFFFFPLSLIISRPLRSIWWPIGGARPLGWEHKPIKRTIIRQYHWTMWGTPMTLMLYSGVMERSWFVICTDQPPRFSTHVNYRLHITLHFMSHWRQSKQTPIATNHGQCVANRDFEEQRPNQHLMRPNWLLQVYLMSYLAIY